MNCVQKRKLQYMPHTHTQHTSSGSNNCLRKVHVSKTRNLNKEKAREAPTFKRLQRKLCSQRPFSPSLPLSLSLSFCHVNKITFSTHHFDNVLRCVVGSCNTGLHLTESEKMSTFTCVRVCPISLYRALTINICTTQLPPPLSSNRDIMTT